MCDKNLTFSLFPTFLIRFCPLRADAIKRTSKSSDMFQHFASKILILPLANRWIIVPKQKENNAQHSQEQHLKKFNDISSSTHLVDWIPPKKPGPQIVMAHGLGKGQGAMTSRIITLAVAASASYQHLRRLWVSFP